MNNKKLIALTLLVLAVIFWFAGSRALQGKAAAPFEKPEFAAQPAASASMLEVSSVSSDGRSAVSAAAIDSQQGFSPSALPLTPQGLIRGRVIDQFGSIIGPASLKLQGKSGLLRSTKSTDGTFELQAPPGSYTLQIEEDSLPPGYLTPWKQGQIGKVYRDQPDFPNGFFATEVTVPEGGAEVHVELRVFQAALVAGYVRGQRGEPIEGAIVRIQSCLASAPTGLESTSKTDLSGRYEMLEVYPGKYRTEVWLNETTLVEYRSMTPPLPERVSVIEGGLYEVPTLVVGGGNHIVRGEVVNQDGAPFAGLSVMAYLNLPTDADEIPFNWSSEVRRCTTDEWGRFSLQGLPSVPIKVQVAADYEPGIPLGVRRAAFWVYPVELDLRAAPIEVEMPRQQVDESRPYFLKGRVELDRDWVKDNRTSITQIEVSVDRLYPDQELPDAPRRPPFTREILRVNPATGEFVWAAETPMAPVVLRVSSRRGKPACFEQTLHPEANRTEELKISLR